MNELKLKPMDIGDILDGSFRLYKNNFAKFVHIMAPIYIISFMAWMIYLQALSSLGLSSKAGFLNIGIGIVGILFAAAFGVLSWVLKFVAVGALVYSVSGAYLGKDIRYKDAYKRVWTQFWPLVGAGFLSGLMISVGKMMLIIPGVILAIFLSLVAHVIVLEKDSVGGSISRSFELVAYSFWKAFLVCFVSYIIVIVISGAVYLPFYIWMLIKSFSSGATPQQYQYPMLVQVFQLAIRTFVELLTAPFWMVALTLLYYDVRVRKEGFDLEVMARSLGYEIPGGQEQGQGQESSHPNPESG